MSGFEQNRVAFGDALRLRREATGVSGRDFARALGWNNSKVSKIERGRQTPSDADVVAWLTEVGAAPEETEKFRDRLRSLRVEQIGWRRQLREGHRARQEQDLFEEAEATTIQAFDTAAVPGLLQTPDYARHILRSQAEFFGVPDDVDEAVQARMRRQNILYDTGRTIDLLMTESALAHPVCPPATLAAQLDRLGSAIGLPGVRFGIVPAGRQLPFVPWHGFWIVDEVVFVENVHDERRVHDPGEVAFYRKLADALWESAAVGEDARAIITAARKTLPS